ncbi:MAG: peptide chain release factor 1 [Clostridia bacterium]|nr:peptide chain release factor 1 [Clostridia bacterium]
MHDRFSAIEDRLAEIAEAIVQPEILADQAKYQSLLKEHAALSPAVEAWRHFTALQSQLAGAEELAADPDFAEEAHAEVTALTERIAAMEAELRRFLIPRDPDDDRSVVIEIRAGAGGEEACLFAADMLRLYTRFAERSGFRVEPVSLSDTELGGVKEAVFTVTGNGAFARFKYESGVHRVQRVPVTDTTGKKQTSTCTVAVLPEAEEVDLVIDPRELRIDAYRATGHGGQYINTTDSAVRITHLPTGLVVTCQDEKSQLKNRERAMKVLRSRLLEKRRADADAAYAEKRRLQVGTGDRSERIRTYNFHESRVTDHRIGLTVYRIQDVMDGDLTEIIDALRMADEALRGKEGS